MLFMGIAEVQECKLMQENTFQDSIALREKNLKNKDLFMYV